MKSYIINEVIEGKEVGLGTVVYAKSAHAAKNIAYRRRSKDDTTLTVSNDFGKLLWEKKGVGLWREVN